MTKGVIGFILFVKLPFIIVVELNNKVFQVVTFVLLYIDPELQGLNVVLVLKIGDGVTIGEPLTLTVTILLYKAAVGEGANLNTLLCFKSKVI